MDVDLEAPDHTTLSRRSQRLNVQLAIITTDRPLHLIVDSTGLSIVGEGEWAAVKYGGRGRRGWRKLHLGVDESDVIVAEALSDGNADDAKTGLNLIDDVEGDIAEVDGVLRITKIRLRYRFTISPGSRDKVKRALETYAEKCPAYQSVKGCIDCSWEAVIEED